MNGSDHCTTVWKYLMSLNCTLKSGLVTFFSFIFISWRVITLQYCSGFCHTLTWISHGFTCIPHPDPPSHLPLYPIPLFMLWVFYDNFLKMVNKSVWRSFTQVFLTLETCSLLFLHSWHFLPFCLHLSTPSCISAQPWSRFLSYHTIDILDWIISFTGLQVAF